MPRLKLKLPEFFSPAGAGIVMICFFLPWVRVSCGGKNVILSGAKIGGMFWIILALAALMLAAYIFFKVNKAAHKARLVLQGGAILSLGIIVYQSIMVMVSPDIPFYIPSALINFRMKPGSWGTLAGLMMILGSSLYLRAPGKKKNDIDKSETG